MKNTSPVFWKVEKLGEISTKEPTEKLAPNRPVEMRRTYKAYSFVRNRQEVELASFIEKDKTAFKAILNKLIKNASKRFVTHATVFKANSRLKFSVKILENLRSEIPVTNRIHITIGHNSWSKFEKCIQFLNLMQIDKIGEYQTINNDTSNKGNICLWPRKNRTLYVFL